MVGALIVAHSHIGKELIATAEYLVGKMDGIVAVSIDFKMNTFEARKIISEAIRKIDQGEGVLILTDLFGGVPSNIAFSLLLDKEKMEVITGVNLPMILTFWNKRENIDLMELAKALQLSGRRNIVVAKNLMETKSDFGRVPMEGKRLLQE
jgi:PTS system mannose-specific IIA component